MSNETNTGIEGVKYQPRGTSPVLPIRHAYAAPFSHLAVLTNRDFLTARNGPLYFTDEFGISVPLYHHGMYISIVDDTQENNGLWFLEDALKGHLLYNVNDSATYGGWRKLCFADEASTSSVVVDDYTIKDGYGVADEDDSQVEGLRVVRVDGGSFSDEI